MCTKFGSPYCAGVTSSTAPTSTPWYLTSDRCGSPSPTLTSAATTRTCASIRPVDLTSSAPETTNAITNSATPHASNCLSVGPRPSISREFATQPPNLAPASTDHNAIVSSMLTMITTVMLARIAWPAATPTPTGPPLA